jgi:hypothetical protein
MKKNVTVAEPADLDPFFAKVAESAVATMNDPNMPDAEISHSGRRPKRSTQNALATESRLKSIPSLETKVKACLSNKVNNPDSLKNGSEVITDYSVPRPLSEKPDKDTDQ